MAMPPARPFTKGAQMAICGILSKRERENSRRREGFLAIGVSIYGGFVENSPIGDTTYGGSMRISPIYGGSMRISPIYGGSVEILPIGIFPMAHPQAPVLQKSSL